MNANPDQRGKRPLWIIPLRRAARAAAVAAVAAGGAGVSEQLIFDGRARALTHYGVAILHARPVPRPVGLSPTRILRQRRIADWGREGRTEQGEWRNLFRAFVSTKLV